MWHPMSLSPERCLDHPTCEWVKPQLVGAWWTLACLQNWRSELSAVGSFAMPAVFLRQQGAPESKPMSAEHAASGGPSWSTTTVPMRSEAHHPRCAASRATLR